MRPRVLAVALAVAAAAASSDARARAVLLQEVDSVFAARIDPVIESLWTAFDRLAALDHVRYVAQFWRVPGNAGYDAAIDRLHERLTREIAMPRGAGALARHLPRVFVTSGPPARAWDHEIGTLAIVRDGAPDDVVLSRERDRLALCINSFPTPAAGITAPLVDVGRGDRDEDYAGKDVKGAVVLGDADAGQLWRRAVVSRGAIGIVSSSLAPYISPDPPGATPTPRDQWDILQWGSIPYDEARKGFGFKASPRAAARLRAAVRTAGARSAARDVVRATVRVTIASSFTSNPVRTLVVEFPGAGAPDERVVLAAHVQEPGANDNASGVATLAELVVSLWRGIARQHIPAPSRTLTVLFLDEISGSREWLKTNAAAVPGVKYMFSLDMTGEDVAKTGGSFLVERYPDPGAVWDRPWDPHSEWGRGDVRAGQLKGDLINDVHLAVARRVARRTDWVVKSNPYEGGSDHTVFGSAGIPAVLDWHFTDRYYHTNFDTPDKTSADEMRNVAVAVGATAWFLASADESAALAAARVVAAAGRARIAVEEREGAKLAAADADPAAARAREATILAAWRQWYAEAVRSAARLVVGAPSEELARGVGALAQLFDEKAAGSASAAVEHGPFVGEDAAQNQENQRAETPLFRCGVDASLPQPIPLRWETIALAVDGRMYMPCPDSGHPNPAHREAREFNLLARASASPQPDFRRLAALGAGRLQRFPNAKLLNDPVPEVRRAAAVAIADAVSAPANITPDERGGPAQSQERLVASARGLIETRLGTEADPVVRGALLESLGRLRYQIEDERTEVEKILVGNLRVHPAVRYGVAKGLEALIRGNPRRPVEPATRALLRTLTTVGLRTGSVPTVAGPDSAPTPGPDDLNARTRLLAVAALNAIRDDDVQTLTEAARNPEWQVRRLVAQRLDVARPELRPIVNTLAIDLSSQVRYDVIAPIARAAGASKDCADLARYLDDRSMTVVLRAIDALPDECSSEDDLVKVLTGWSEDLERPGEASRWHRPAHSMMALARIRPDAAKPFVPLAEGHPIWQVRAAAIAAAERMAGEDVAHRLVEDRHPNVRTAALQSLRRLNSPRLWRAAIEALAAEDHQLLMTAATVLQKAPAEVREDAVVALLNAVRRLTTAAWDTSRDPRLAIIERLGELLAPQRASDLSSLVEDFDPRVGAAASRAIVNLTGAMTPPKRVAPLVRYPQQPTVEQLTQMPTRAIVKMQNLGTMEIELYSAEAPVTVARFASLARSGYYNGLTFHRVVPNFVVQGGSPNANEYAGAERYMRDEVGTHPHLRGSVGISTRGRDTGDAQIFIDLVDLPRLDHEYTVFGRVVLGYDVLDRILEGAVIESITVK